MLSRLRPVVWLLQDQWAYTGHVAYSLDCERWRHGCGSCPYLGEYPRLQRDTSAILWRLKDHKHAAGWLFGAYCVLAGLERIIVEFFRAKAREPARASG